MKVKITPNAVYVSNSPPHFNGVWNAKRRMWKLPNTIGALEEINNYKPSKELADYIRKRKLTRSKIINLKNLKDTEGLPQLRPYQRVDVAYLRKIPHVGIFSEMRTGKTPVSIQLLGKGINMVIAPASILLKWEEEINQWSPDFETVVIKGNRKTRSILYKKAEESESVVIIVSYETLRNDVDWIKIKKYSTVITDEAHRICNHKSGIAKASCKIAKLAEKRVAITGTPVRNKPQDIYGILTFLYPERFTGFWQFAERYFHLFDNGQYMEVGGYKREKELVDTVDLLSVNRKRKEVMPWLPDKDYVTVKLEMKEAQDKVYKEVLNTFQYKEDGEVKVDASDVLPQLTRLRQITLAPEILDIKAPSVKEQYVMDWLADNPNEQVIIFATFSSYLRILQQKLRKESVALIDGRVSKVQRNGIVKDFQAGRVRILLANIVAGGVGLTLDKAEVAIFMDKDYTPIHNDQAEDRIIPVTQERNHSCTIISLVAKGTVDEKVEAVLRQKQNVINVINDMGIRRFLQ